MHIYIYVNIYYMHAHTHPFSAAGEVRRLKKNEQLWMTCYKNILSLKKNKKNKKKQDHVYPGSEWVYPVGPGWSRLSIAIGQRRSQGRRPPWGPPLSLKKLVKHNHPFRFLFLFFSFSSLKKKCIGGIVDLQCCVSVVQQSDSVIHIHISTRVQILFPYRPLQNIEQSFL